MRSWNIFQHFGEMAIVRIVNTNSCDATISCQACCWVVAKRQQTQKKSVFKIELKEWLQNQICTILEHCVTLRFIENVLPQPKKYYVFME